MKLTSSIICALSVVAIPQLNAQTTKPAGPAKPPVPQAPQTPAQKPTLNPAIKPVADPATPAKPPIPANRPAAKPPLPGNPAVKQVNNPFNAPNPTAIAVPANGNTGGRNLSAEEVAEEYTKYTGKRVLLSSATANLEVSFVHRGPLTNSEAAELLVATLDMEGYVFVPYRDNIVKFLPKTAGATTNPTVELQNTIHDPGDVPADDSYCSYFMRLNFIKPEEALRIFTQSIHQLGPGAKLTPVPNASAIIITGKGSFIRKLINQKQYIDVATGNLDTQWIALRYADAEEVATQLNEIMNAQRQRKTTAGVTTQTASRTSGNRPPVPSAPRTSSAGAAGSSAAGEDIPITIVGNTRLNKILLMGRPVDILFVETLVREFDSPPNRNTFVKRKLRFLIASDFLDIAEDALLANNATGTTQQQGGRSGGRSTSRNQPQQNRNNNRSNQGQGGSGAESVQEFNVSEVPESRVVGKTFIVADNLANSVLVQGPPESIRIVSELLDKLDGRPQQVMISTVFGEITLGKDRDIGVSLGRVSDGANGGSRDGAGKIDTGLGALQDIQALGTIAGLNAAPSTGGLNIYGSIGNLSATVRALETQSNFTVLNRPTVYTANNRRARIESGRRIAVPTNTFQNGGNNGATQSTNIEYREVVLRFEVVPLINSDTEVTLRISLLNEDTQGTQIIDGNEIPTIVTESLVTTVSVPNEATIVLGGLVSESNNVTKTGVPLLSNIPLLGRLFRRDDTAKTRRELLIFIQPKIITGPHSLAEAQADMDSRYDVSKDTRKFADGPGIAPTVKQTPQRSSKPASRSTKSGVPSASSRPHLRYPTRR